jgi:hypothetical protein
MLNKTNTAQKIILAIFIPIVLFFIGYGVLHNSDIYPEDLDESWGGWVIVFLLIGIVEFFLFKSPKSK